MPPMTANGTFIFTCASCGYRARMPATYAGRSVACPGCQAPQVAIAPPEAAPKTASILRVAATPVPFSLPAEQEAALAAAAAPPRAVVPPQTTPLPGAIRISTDRVAKPTQPTAQAAPGQSPSGLVNAVKDTVDFTCLSCKARLRLPGHYAGKSILCPKCNEPQKVVPNPVPMDTTRSLAQREEVRAAQPVTGRTVRVTPLPRTYPTPMPSSVSTPTPTLTPLAALSTPPAAAVAPAVAPVIVAALPVAAPAPAALPIATPAPVAPAPTPMEPMGEIDPIAAAAGGSDELPLQDPIGGMTISKPHPSKGKAATSKFNRPATAAIPSAPVPAPPAPKTPVGLLIAIGVLGIATIGFGAGMVYHLLALNHMRDRLAETEQSKKALAESTSTQLKELEAKLHELETRLSATETKTPAPAPVPAAGDAAAPVAPAAEVKPAEAPVAPAPAPAPAVEPAPAPAPATP